MNNPFYYIPSKECRQAVQELADWLNGKSSPFCDHPVNPAFRAEIDKGKMFGVLVVEGSGSFGNQHHNLRGSLEGLYLAAYSGQVCGRADWPEFVPAVFDYLQPDGYFKQHEAEIVKMNNQIEALQGRASCSSECGIAPHLFSDDPCPVFKKQKRKDETDEEFIKRRQYENAELHRWKLRQREREAELKQKEDDVKALKTLRKQKSDDLQRWLFRHFVMMNGRGESKDIIDIFNLGYSSFGNRHASLRGGLDGLLPPSGSGECCEPKLLQYAFTHGLKPVSMAMFWWGDSPKGEVRHHMHFYPACNSKCKPILKWMLQGVDVDPNPLEDKEQDEKLASMLRVLYEDSDIYVISKPAGLMSVPGKNGRESVYSIIQRRFQEQSLQLNAYIVHRLDMATSGLMIIAKTAEAYHYLQKQFANHEVKKRYVAILDKQNTKEDSFSGSISLPLRPDLDDRPRQMVDFEHGKPAITRYKFVGANRIWLWPETGRTHQLRVHCAHKLGLNNPIKGDELYGTRSTRLYLHAEEITFTHPTTGRKMTFTDKAPF